jgi:hypothetical protein
MGVILRARRGLPVMVILAFLVAGCGSSAGHSTGASADPATVVKQYLTAIADGDGSTACSLMTTDAQNRLMQSLRQAGGSKASKLTCAKVFSLVKSLAPASQLKQLRDLHLVTVSMSKTVAVVKDAQNGARDELVRSDGRWLIAGALPA